MEFCIAMTILINKFSFDHKQFTHKLMQTREAILKYAQKEEKTNKLLNSIFVIEIHKQQNKEKTKYIKLYITIYN